MLSPRLSTVLVVLCLVTGCQCGGGGEVPTVPEKVVGHCVYMNRFSSLEECRDYVGEWTDEAAVEDCKDQGSTAVLGSACNLEQRLGYCFLGGEDDRWTRISFPGVDAQKCGSMQRGCELFGGGVSKIVKGKAVNVLPAQMASDVAISGHRIAVSTNALAPSGSLVTATLGRSHHGHH